MTRFTLDINDNFDENDKVKMQEILLALVSCGGLLRVKGGKTIIHYDGQGNFMGVELDYWPFRRRKDLVP